MKRSTKVVLFFMGALEELIVNGLATAKCLISAEGWKAYQELKATGFQPTEQEMHDCTQEMMKDPRIMAKFKQPTYC